MQNSLELPEQWKEIPDTDRHYAASTHGRIRRIIASTRGRRNPDGIMALSDQGKGYLKVNLCVNNKITQHLVHVLIAKTWLGPSPASNHQVNHKNGVRSDCYVSNLEWATPSDNNTHAYQVLKRRPPRGNRSIAISPEEFAEIKSRHAAGETQSEIAKSFNVSQVRISQIIREGMEKKKRLTAREYRYIRERRSAGERAVDLAKEFNLHESQIRRIVKEPEES